MSAFSSPFASPVYSSFSGVFNSAYLGGEETLPDYGNLIAQYKGVTSDDGTRLLASSGNHSGQVKGTSVLGDGTGYGTLSETVTLKNDFEISFSCSVVDDGTDRMLFYNSTVDQLKWDFILNRWEARISSENKYFGDVTYKTGRFTFKRVGTTLTLSNETQSQSVTCVSTDFGVGLWKGISTFKGNLYDIVAGDYSGPGGTYVKKLDLAMTCLDSNTEYSSTPGLPDCVWSSFVGDPIVEHTDGSGSNRANESGFSEYENLFKNSQMYPEDMHQNDSTINRSVGIDGVVDTSVTITDSSTIAVGRVTYNEPGIGAFTKSAVIRYFIKKETTHNGGVGLECTIYGVVVDYHFISFNPQTGVVYDPMGTTNVTSYNDSWWVVDVYSVSADSGNTSIQPSVAPSKYIDGTVTEDVNLMGECTIGNMELIANVTLADIEGYPPVYTTASEITGRQPADFQSRITQYPGPISPDGSFVDMPCLQGDGTGFVDLSANISFIGDFKVGFTLIWDGLESQGITLGDGGLGTGLIFLSSAAVIQVYIGGNTPNFSEVPLVVDVLYSYEIERIGSNLTVTRNDGVFQTLSCNLDTFTIRTFATYTTGILTSKIWNLKIYNSSGTLIHHYPMESGHPTHNPDILMVEDVVGGNHGLCTDFVGTAWGTRDTGDFELAKGFSVDRLEATAIVGGDMSDPNKFSGDNWTIDGTANHTADGVINYLNSLDNSIKDNTLYRIECDIVKTSGAINISLRGTTSAALSGGYNSIELISGEGGTSFGFRADTTFTGEVDNVSVKEIIPGYSAVNPLTNLHQDGTAPTYKKNAWDTVLALPASFKGALGPETQGITLLASESEVNRLVDEPSFSTDGQVAIGAKGMALYSSDQTDNVYALDRVLGILGDELAINGTFDTDTDWEKSVGITIANGIAVFVDATGQIYKNEGVEAGKRYVSIFTLFTFTDGIGFRSSIGSAIGTLRTAPGTYIDIVEATSTAFGIKTQGVASGTVDNFSVKQITRD